MENTYLPLFRKYRPQSFDDVIGQEALVKALSNAIELNRIANAYLFCGPRGTGKTSCARIFAKSLNCIKGPTVTPCQECPSCIDITNATGLDVIEIDAASNRGIQDAKDLISQVQYAPINGKYKIFIIDEVHMLSNDAFNALLKTFEEPPKNVIFILATTEPHKVLETIISRCQRFDFRRITTDDITKRLRKISDLENIKITDSALYTIAKNVSGGMRDSLALLDQVSILSTKEEITKEIIEDLLGKINFNVLLNLLKDISDENIENSIKDINEIYAKGNEPRNLAENFIEFLRNIILVINSTSTEKISDFTILTNDDFDKIKALNFNKDKIFKILNTIIEYYKEIKVSTNPYLWMELAAISACKIDLNIAKTTVQQPQIQQIQTPIINSTPKIQKAVSMQAPIQQSQKPQIQQVQQPTPQPIQEQKPPIQQNANTSPIPPEVAQNQDSAQIWSNVLSAIPSLPTKALYSGTAKLIKVENKTITLGFTHDNALVQAKLPTKLAMLETTVKNLYPDYSIEMIKVDANTKYIEVKPKLRQESRPQRSEIQPNTYPQKPQAQSFQNTENANEKVNEEEEEETPQSEKKHYSSKVQEMLEQFNGRIIE